MHIGLVTQPNKSFSQNGHACVPGREIPQEVWQDWMQHDPNTLTNRLQGGWVAWLPIEDADDAPAKTGPAIDSMDREALVEFAKVELGVKLDGRSKVDVLRQQVRAMIDRQALIRNAQSRTAAEAAKGAAAPPVDQPPVDLTGPEDKTPPADPAPSPTK